MAIKYGNPTTTKSVSVSYPVSFILTARGDGSQVAYLFLKTSVNSTVKVTGSAKMYDDTAGTVGEAISKNLTANTLRYVYIRLASGTASIYLSTKKITYLALENGTATKSPKVSGDFSNYVKLETLSISARANFTSSITKLTAITYLVLNADCNEGNITGIVDGLATTCTHLSLIDNVTTRINGASIIVSGNLGLFTENPFLELVNDTLDRFSFTGDLTNVDPLFFYGQCYQDCNANISAWTNCYYLENDCPNITGNTIAGMAACGYIQPASSVFTTAQINQFLADLRANVATVKGYGPSETTRTFNLEGAVGTGAPSGQGLIDKQWLIDWVGGLGQRNNVTTR